MFVLLEYGFGRAGCDESCVYEFDDTSDADYIEDYAYEVAVDHAQSYGEVVDMDELDGEYDDSDYDAIDLADIWSTFEVLDLTREEIEEYFGDIVKA